MKKKPAQLKREQLTDHQYHDACALFAKLKEIRLRRQNMQKTS